MAEISADRFTVTTLELHRVQAIRRSVAQSTIVFQASFGIPAPTITNWEQGRRKLDCAASRLIRLIEADADLVRRVAQEAIS